jgi:group I intron endonuclease
LAFNSVEHIMRDVDNGYILRYTHANVASFFFIFVYAHIGRGLWYGSYRSPRVLVWSIGVIILVLMMAIGFLGYVYSPKWFNLITNNLITNNLITTMLMTPRYLAALHLLISTLCLFTFAAQHYLDFDGRGFALVFHRFRLAAYHSTVGLNCKSAALSLWLCQIVTQVFLGCMLSDVTCQMAWCLQSNLPPVQRSAFLSMRLQTQLKKYFYPNINSLSLYGNSYITLRRLSSTTIRSEDSGKASQHNSQKIRHAVSNQLVDTPLAQADITTFPPLTVPPYGSIAAISATTTLLSDTPATEAEINTQKLKKIISNRLTEFLIDNELNPIFYYEDLQLDEVRKKISFETGNLSGVYMVLNKVTLDFYIGSASTGKFYSRFYRHLISFNGSKIVKFAVKKYKLTSFAFLVLELFPEIVTKENNNKLIALEDFYLKTMLPNYNILTEAGSSFGYKHTEITRLNMSKNYSQARKEWIKNLNKGKTLSPETIEKIRERALNRKPLIYSAEALANMKKRSKPIILYNLDRTVYGNFPSISEAAKTVGCVLKPLTRALKTEKKILKKRFIVKLP